MDLGIFARTFTGTTPASVLQAARAAGYRAVQYNMACSGLASIPNAIAQDVARAVSAASLDAGVKILAVSATYNMVHPDRHVRMAGLSGLAAIAEKAHMMGTRALTLCTGTRDPHDRWKKHPDNGSSDAWRDLMESMEAALRVSEKHDLDLAIEPEQANVVSSARRARCLIDGMKSSRLKVVLDPANLFDGASASHQRSIIAEAVDLLADRIVIAHVKDRLWNGSFVAPGKGLVEHKFFFERLKTIGFSGPLVTHGLSEEEAPQVATLLRCLLGELGIEIAP